MTTPRDLLIVTLDVAPIRPLERGDLSLALAGAELIDLLGAEALGLEEDRIVPRLSPATGDRMLDEAASSLQRQPPYEPVGDWLWRRGRDLTPAYLDALEAAGQVTRRRHGWLPVRPGQAVPVDSPARRHATDRWSSDEPVLASLAAAIGVREEPTGDVADGVADEAVVTVLATVNDAVMELEAVRQRRAIEQAAYDNVWRGP
ncbi:GOLPH3/VPS74 family protein [Streptomyces sp. S465]|uniref:GOLPH3/VPS74 family protein n=1 Tax=Streptomyces sp. S465 TaxID=2979468 RepID=UPI0022A87EE2|nr:GPP34 family phosphoprotein [Streptomyces sp. S465]WAP59788.1 GPP34 family phosphoprotein [Streptomyces sp. S465]